MHMIELVRGGELVMDPRRRGELRRRGVFSTLSMPDLLFLYPIEW